ncbi:L-type lectin-domain containing receptor kinase IX.1-like [Magnolia sinica]|uniref:L-type lectin-domain containing receptor kinase IX.1-like n=1 Tax=Magnolia sinica TaxID=86752 RepID=UPI00265A23F0|nr:L-type lectin-domain containing receptor kinase IX.1-like [Magnolia sinica]
MAKILSSCLFFFSLLSSFLPISTSSTIFNFTSFTPNTPDIIFSGDAFPSGENVIQLTRNQADTDLLQSSGRAIYASPIQIWNPATRMAADFITHFRFIVKGLDELHFGDGLAFFMAPVSSKLPENSTGKWLGLFNSTTNNATSTRLVAVEFDTFENEWDPSANHIGIDVNTIVSVTNMTWNSNIKSGEIGSAWIGYNSTAKNFYVYLTYGGDSYDGIPSLSYSLDLMEVLPNEVVIGFSAATGSSTELHKILSWDLVSSISSGNKNNKAGHKKRHWVAAFVVMVLVSIAGLGFGVMFWRRKKKGDGDMKDFDSSMEDKFVKETGPRRFTYKQLASATKNFSEDGKLGQGGFGGVFKGVLDGNGTYEIVAVKKISKGSSQGRKEYVSEVTVISRLRHRNLVRLIGWCHENSEFLLVYEYMPNGSLDSHIFGKKTSLMWTIRFKIALGLASALLYLHEEWEQCVVHRDIKSSNVMLDSSFNAKLGDFGLARFVDHGLGSQTTVLAGTMGYLAPECITSGKASKESDVYSFGVVALEIACGRKAVEPKMEEPKVRLVEWVWDLYGCGRLLDAADERLSAHFDEKQMERLMIVGLWCAYPDQKLRPSIRQVIQVLSFEAALPSLPAKMPVPMYLVPPMDMCQFTNTTNLGQQCMDHSCCSCTSCNTSRTMRSSGGASSKFLLNTHKEVDQPHILLRTEV